MKVKDLKKNERNPRKITSEQQQGLRRSVEEFGDLGGIIFNVQSKRLVGGHQRSSVLKPSSTIKIEKKYDKPTKTGTVAEGYVEQDGERFSYREVTWDKQRETEAMIAANKHGGDWDRDLLSVAISEVGDVNLTGFTMPELSDFNIQMPSVEAPKTEEPEESDEEYVKNTPETTEQIPTENPNENVKSDFNDVEETPAQAAEKRFVVIVDCPNAEGKEEMRKKIQPLIEGTEFKIF